MNNSERRPGGPRVAAIERGLNVLNCFLGPKSHLSLAQISAKTGYYKSTALRLCSTLLDLGYLTKMSDGTYALGPLIGALAARYTVENFIDRERCLHEMERLNGTFGESVALYVPVGVEQLCLVRIESPKMVRAAVDEGHRLPIGQEASGMVIEAFRGKKGAAYDAIRETGTAVSAGIVFQDAAGVAAPILREEVGLIGALVIIGPHDRFSAETIDRMRIAVHESAQRLSI